MLQITNRNPTVSEAFKNRRARKGMAEDLETDVSQYLRAVDESVPAGLAKLEDLQATYGFTYEEESDLKQGRFYDGESAITVALPTLDTLVEAYEETEGVSRDRVSHALGAWYGTFSTTESQFYTDGTRTYERQDDTIEQVAQEQKGATLDELCHLYELAREYAPLQEATEILDTMRERFRVADYGQRELFMDQEATKIFDKSAPIIRSPTEEEQAIIRGLDVEPRQSKPAEHIDFGADETLFEQQFNTDTFGNVNQNA